MKCRNSNFLKVLYYKREQFVKSIELAKKTNYTVYINTLCKILEFLFFKMRFPSQLKKDHQHHCRWQNNKG